MKGVAISCLLAAVMVLNIGCAKKEATREYTPRNPAVIDRMGRPEVTNFVIRIPQHKTTYNRSDSFASEPGHKGQYLALLHAGIAFWDSLDASEDWSAPDRQAELGEMLVNDFLVVDTSKVCSVHDDTYLEIERAPAGASATCGGRTPNADVIDSTISLLIAGPRAGDHPFTDGIDRVPRQASDSFPYLATPHESP